MKFALFIISIVAALATSCQSASGQTFTENRFNVHAEMMAEPMRQHTAKNVAIGNQGVTACFNSWEFFCGCNIGVEKKSKNIYLKPLTSNANCITFVSSKQ